MPSRFNLSQIYLPVVEIIPALQSHLSGNNTVVISAPPGAGKSTILPLALLEEPWMQSKKMIVLEPRRLAASSIAHRMADLLGEPVGRTVGYRIRFENKVSAYTRIEVVTEGILTRMLQSDNALEDVGLVFFDEFHERSIHADIALAFCRQTQEILRPDLRLVVMSATLDVDLLSGMLGAQVIRSEGRTFPVKTVYAGELDNMALPESCSRIIVKALQENEGDLLAFLPGQAEIRKCEEILKRYLRDVAIHPLYGQLSHREQQEAILPNPKGRRKVVLATSIAETSLTIEGIKIVVDTGFSRRSTFDPKTGLSGLKTTRISLDAADQRAGRAGRLSEGICYRMWSAATHQRLAAYRNPEILEADLSPLLLDMLQWGVSDIDSLFWLNRPPEGTLASARTLLSDLNAVDTTTGRISEHGKEIHRFPCHPRLANMLILARDRGLLPLATDIAALLEERDPLDRMAGVDINLRIEALRRYRREGKSDRKWEKIAKTATAYRKLLDSPADNSVPDSHAAGLLLAFAYPERIASARPEREGEFQLANGQLALVSPGDALAHEPWLSIAHLDAQKGQGRVFIAAALDPGDVRHLARETENIRWDSRKLLLNATLDLRLGSLVLQSKPVASPAPEKVKEVLSAAIGSAGEQLLDFNEAVQEWQNRVLSLKRWNPEQQWPDVSTAVLLNTNAEWLSEYLGAVRNGADLQRINLLRVLQYSLTFEQQMLLDRLAPASILVPSGSNIKIRYSEHGEDPVLAVRLQELFGMTETPKINEGKKNVVIHLLSPGYKPVQVTADLRSFWTHAYFEVRNELKRRYPKHSWPENPLEAEAVRGVKRR